MLEPTLDRRPRLRDVLADAEFLGSEAVPVQRATDDSRRVQPGDIFVAVAGAQHDGHDHVPEAISRGASAVVAERYVPALGAPLCLVTDSRESLGRLCQAACGQPSDRLRVIGVTGTNGKTTTSLLIAAMLSEAGHSTGVLGTLGTFDGVEWAPSDWTTPTAPELARQFVRMETAGCTHVAMEVSSHALAQRRVAGVQFDAACFTNVRHDHLDFHGAWQNYWSAKARLIQHLRPEGVAIVNADDPGAARFLDRIQGPALTVGIDVDAEIMAQPLESALSEQTFLLCAGTETVVVRSPLIGRHNIQNSLMAAALGLTYGLDLFTIARGLERVSRVPGRLERLECGQPFGVFVDYAHTADALACVLETLRPLTAGRLICVFGAGGDRDRKKRPGMARAASEAADLIVLTNDNPRSEDPIRILRDLLRGCPDPDDVRVEPDRALAIAWALSQARPGDCVLVAGKGHECYQLVGGDRFAFDDREVARRWLYGQSEVLDHVPRRAA